MVLLKLVGLAVIAAAVAEPDAAKLPSLNIDPASVTTSGISAGAFFAVQFHVGFSSLVKGAGIVAGGPFYCARGSENTALTTCMSTGLINDQQLLSYIKNAAQKGDIDPISNLQKHKVVLWSGTNDHTVAQRVMKHLPTQYKELGVPESEILTLFNFSSGHCWPTDFYGGRCGSTGSPYINNCGYDYAGEILNKFYGPNLEPRVGTPPSANLKAFDQSEFSAPSLARTGYFYAPEACAKGKRCRLHVNFHGCEQYASQIGFGTKYVSHTGLNRWAEANDIVVLYPQTKSSTLMPSNPNGCFDWWGYAGSNYATKEGKQMKSVKNMVDRLMGGSPPAPTPPPTPAPPTPPPTPTPPTPPTPPPTPTPPTPPTPPPTPTPPTPPAPTPPPPTPAPPTRDCRGKALGNTCLDAKEYITCPAGLIHKCLFGTCTTVGRGLDRCGLDEQVLV